MSGAPISEKGARYLGQLDQALCNGNWPEVPELARKTDKHAPDRKCLTLTARSEAHIASASHRPTSASSTATASIHSLGEFVPKLTEAIEAEKKHPEDVYIAKVCLAQIHWVWEDLESALKAIPQGEAPPKSGAGHASPLGWLEVCEVKACFIKGAALESTGKSQEARELYLSSTSQSPGSRSPELRKWTERLLARGCMFLNQRAGVPDLPVLSQSLRSFQTWSDFWQRIPPPVAGTGALTSRLDIPRRQVWKAYYSLLSTVLQHGLMYNKSPTSNSDLLVLPSDDLSDEQYTTVRLRQRSAMKRVEATYESLLLNETQFPKASEANTEVEEWIEQAVSNWKLFSGPDWSDSELGDGGKESVTRGVLDILYRAATKTFHSTPILRQLLMVHVALGEFNLAMHAFDSYVEIVSKGKARAAKTGKPEVGLDTDDLAIHTAAEAVRILCRYGDREQGDKAVKVGKMIQSWIGHQEPVASEDTNGDGAARSEDAQNGVPPRVSQLQPKTLATAYRAIGTSQAQWARWTYETDSRSSLQSNALKNLRQSHAFDGDSIETAFALAIVLAEMGDISSATQVIKRALATGTPAEDDDEMELDVFTRQRRSIPLWHLLALCLTANDDYEQGAKMCEAAFEQFGDAAVLFGDSSVRTSSDSEKPLPLASQGIVDQMESFEKEGIIQVKMSQVSFVELIEGPDVAVETSHELLSLYARLFGNPELFHAVTRAPPTAASATPSRLGGTLRSIAGSIRPKSAREHLGTDKARQASTISVLERRTSEESKRPDSQSVGVPIAITVTNEDGMSSQRAHHRKHLPFKMRSPHGDHGQLKPSKSAENLRNKLSTRHHDKPQLPVVNEKPAMNGIEASQAQTPVHPMSERNTSPEAPASPEQHLKEIAHNIGHGDMPPPTGHEEQPPRQDVRLPAPHPSSNLVPDAHLPTAQDRQHKISLLVKIWLFIAGLYLRADATEDAEAAMHEADKLVESFEAEVGAENSSARRFFDKRWGGGKSVDELWADVWSARGNLASARKAYFEAISHYEQALSHYPDHAEGVIGLSNLLMDIYEEKMPAEQPTPPLQTQVPVSGTALDTSAPPAWSSGASENTTSTPTSAKPEPPKPGQKDPTPAELNRLAARDRAYMLLSTLTRLGNGWDNSEAWFTLARAHELSKQLGKAKQALWWVVELEQNKPMRPWSEVSAGGLTL